MIEYFFWLYVTRIDVRKILVEKKGGRTIECNRSLHSVVNDTEGPNDVKSKLLNVHML